MEDKDPELPPDLKEFIDRVLVPILVGQIIGRVAHAEARQDQVEAA